MGVSLSRIEEVVGAACDGPPDGLHEVGRGAWSTAYRFGACGRPQAGPGRRPWREALLALDDDHAGTRLEGWRDSLRRSSAGVDAFVAGIAALDRLDLGDVELTLTHGDLINRNMHVDRDRATGVVRLTGIFDWGCMRWGDHLYDLAWFDFWGPWHPELDVMLLRGELDRRWDAGGTVIERRAERERACLTHIGLDHLAYNASIEAWSDLDDVVRRMGALDLI